ncbi:MAG: threonylcarbamoyl-AMP synthase [Spirochaetota bacterium]|nr:threonylcarbamoyl-AMP synthase [Spirochaetota bacterium]
MNKSLQLAIDAILSKECVVFPTETVYGLGADAFCHQSVSRIFELKNRPPSNPLIVHIATIDQILSVTTSLSPLEQKLFEKFSPGPLSLILPKKKEISSNVTCGLNTVGVRIPNHPIALEFLSAVNLPICAPSANISGQPSPTTYEMAKFYMEDKAIILDGGTLDIGIESTVVKTDGNKIYILRSGFITAEMIADQIGIVPSTNTSQEHHSPGTQFTHYKPKATIIAFEGTPPKACDNSALLFINYDRDLSSYQHVFHFDNAIDYAHALYYTFFQCDKLNISTIYCELPPNHGQGVALRDRLIKASQ